MSAIKLPWKNAMRRPARFWLTALSICVAFFLYTVIFAINAALNATGSDNNQFRLMTTHKISITKSVPLNYQNKMNVIEGVDNVTYVSWFGGFFRDERNQLQAVAVDPQTYFDIYPEYVLAEGARTTWRQIKSGIIIGQALADKYQWRVGDKVPIQSTIWMSNTTSSFTWEFEVTGIYQTDAAETNQQMIFMRHDYLDENRGYGRYYVSWLVAKLSRGANADGVSHAIDKVFENSTAETRTTTEQVFVKEQAQQFVDLSWILKLVVLAVFFTLLLIASNSMSQSIRERMNELAVMKSLGFSSGKLIASVYMEALLIIFVGAASGVLIAAFGLDVVQQKLATFLPGIHIQASHYVQIVVMIFSLALICCVSPALSIYRLTISKALRT